jgi:predicted nucleotide-binding protein
LAVGLDDNGKSKATLVQRLLGEPIGLDDSDDQHNGDDGRDGDDVEESRAERSHGVRTGKKVEQLRLFIGSSMESLKVAKRVQVELDYDFDVTIWHQSLFEPGTETWRQLVNMARNDFDFALFVFGSDDAIESRKQSTFSPRDNVLLEYGLFVGAIGPERTFFLHNRSHKPKIASDLACIMALTYRVRDNLQAALGPACTQLHDICETWPALTGKRCITPTCGSWVSANARTRCWGAPNRTDVVAALARALPPEHGRVCRVVRSA